MKVIILSLFATLFIAGVFADEKADAISQINLKYDEIFKYSHIVVSQISNEMGKREPEVEKQTNEYGDKVKSSTLTQFAAEAKKVARTAVAKGKPLSTFDCLAKVSLEGREQILNIHKDFTTRINYVVPQRKARLGVSQVSAALILNAVTELKEEAIQNINKTDSGIQSLKNDAIRKIENGRKQLANLEACVHKPTLIDEYVEIRQNMDTRYKDVKESLYKRLQKCLV